MLLHSNLCVILKQIFGVQLVACPIAATRCNAFIRCVTIFTSKWDAPDAPDVVSKIGNRVKMTNISVVLNGLIIWLLQSINYSCFN